MSSVSLLNPGDVLRSVGQRCRVCREPALSSSNIVAIRVAGDAPEIYHDDCFDRFTQCLIAIAELSSSRRAPIH